MITKSTAKNFHNRTALILKCFCFYGKIQNDQEFILLNKLVMYDPGKLSLYIDVGSNLNQDQVLGMLLKVI